MIKGYVKLVNSKTQEETYCVLDPITLPENVYDGIVNKTPVVNPNITVSFYRINDGYNALRCAMQLITEANPVTTSSYPSDQKKKSAPIMELSNQPLNKVFSKLADKLEENKKSENDVSSEGLLNKFLNPLTGLFKSPKRKGVIKSYSDVSVPSNLTTLIESFAKYLNDITDTTEKEYLKSSFEGYLENVDSILKKYKDGEDVTADLESLLYDTKNLNKVIDALKSGNKDELKKVVNDIYSYVEKTVIQPIEEQPTEEQPLTPPTEETPVTPLSDEEPNNISDLINEFNKLIEGITDNTEKEDLKSSFEKYLENVDTILKDHADNKDVSDALHSLEEDTKNLIDTIKQLTSGDKQNLLNLIYDIYHFVEKTVSQPITPVETSSLKNLIHSIENSVNKLISTESNIAGHILSMDNTDKSLTPPSFDKQVEDTKQQLQPNEIYDMLLEKANKINDAIDSLVDYLKNNEITDENKEKLTKILTKLDDLITKLYSILETYKDSLPEDVYSNLTTLVGAIDDAMDSLLNSDEDTTEDSLEKLNNAIDEFIEYVNNLLKDKDNTADVKAENENNITDMVENILEKCKEILETIANKTQEELNKVKGKITILLHQLIEELTKLLNELKGEDGELTLDDLIKKLNEYLIELNQIFTEIAKSIVGIPANVEKKIDDIVNKIINELNYIFGDEEEPTEEPVQTSSSKHKGIAKTESLLKRMKNKRKNRRSKILKIPSKIFQTANKLNPLTLALKGSVKATETLENGVEKIGEEINEGTKKMMNLLFPGEKK